MNLDIWSFLLGIASSIIIPLFKIIIKYFTDTKTKKDFIKMIKKEYVEPIRLIPFENISDDKYKTKLWKLSGNNDLQQN